MKHGFVKFGIGIGIGFETFPIFWMVSDSVSKKCGIEKSTGFGIGKNWFKKKVSDLVSQKFGIEKSIGFGIEKILYRKKVSDSVSFRFLVSSHTALELVPQRPPPSSAL